MALTNRRVDVFHHDILEDNIFDVSRTVSGRGRPDLDAAQKEQVSGERSPSAKEKLTEGRCCRRRRSRS